MEIGEYTCFVRIYMHDFVTRKKKKIGKRMYLRLNLRVTNKQRENSVGLKKLLIRDKLFLNSRSEMEFNPVKTSKIAGLNFFPPL